MKAPGFWARDGVLPRLFMPAAAAVAAITARRVAQPGARVPVPVICCGGATVGGAGKTTLAIDLLRRLQARGIAAQAVTRGHGGRARGVLRVDPARHDARLVGDEALLLAAVAPTHVARDRAAGTRAAVAAGAAAIVLDDGLQNPGLHKDCALLVIDGATGFGNRRVLPAGPLREPVGHAASRSQAAVIIGADRMGAAAALPPALPVLQAALMPGPATMELAGRRVFAVAGIAFPGKFHATLRQAGADIAGQMDFADHHRFTPRDWRQVLARAAALRATPVTTAKDAARLPPAWRAQVLVADVGLQWTAASHTVLDHLLDGLFA